MELRALRYFVVVAEECHFGEAARRLHIAQPAVSKQIARLERDLGLRLFDRTSRRVRLSRDGEAFLPHARRVLTAAADATRSARTIAAGGAGILRVGTSGSLGPYLHDVLADVRERAPGVDVELCGGTTPQKIAAVRDGLLDAAFVRAAAPTTGIRLHRLWDEPLLALVPATAGHTLAAVSEVPLSRLRRDLNPGLFDLMTAICLQHGFAPVDHGELTRVQDAIAGPIAAGTAWTFTYAALGDPAVPAVRALPIDHPGVPTALAAPAADSVRPEVAIFVDAAVRLGARQGGARA